MLGADYRARYARRGADHRVVFRPVLRDSLLGLPTGRRHDELRGPVLAAVSAPPAVGAALPRLFDEVERFVDDLVACGRPIGQPELRARILLLEARTVLGVIAGGAGGGEADDAAAARALAAAQQIFAAGGCAKAACNLLSVASVPGAYAARYACALAHRFAHRGAVRELRGIVAAALLRREAELDRAGQCGGMLGALLGDRALRGAAAVDNVVGFFFGAGKPSANAAGCALLRVAEHPGVQRRLAAEAAEHAPGGGAPAGGLPALNALRYTDQVAREVLRIAPGVGMENIVCRWGGDTLRAADGARHPIPSGCQVHVPLQALLYSRATFESALPLDEFRPERWAEPHDTHAYLPFGVGARSCAGRGIAGAALRALLVTVARRCSVELRAGGALLFAPRAGAAAQ